MVQVTTCSRLLAKADKERLESDLQLSVVFVHLKNIQTEDQFCTRVRDFYKKCETDETLLVVQCEDGNHSNNLIACATYCIQDERAQSKERMRLMQGEEDETFKPAHVVFVIKLSHGTKGFTSFQGSGIWQSVHIDDLQPAQYNRPEVSSLTDVDIIKIFEQDLDVQAWMEMDMRDEARVEENSIEDVEQEDDEEFIDGAMSEEGDGGELVVKQNEEKPGATSHTQGHPGIDKEEEHQDVAIHAQQDSLPTSTQQASSPNSPTNEVLRSDRHPDDPSAEPSLIDVENQTQQDSTPSSTQQVSSPNGPTSEVLPSDSDPDETSAQPCPIDVNCLIRDSLHWACARITDDGQDSERMTRRVTTLMKLLTSGCPEEREMGGFLTVAKQRLYQLLKEKQTTSGMNSKSWLTREALKVADRHSTGTFRKTVWQYLVDIISPLLAELVAYSDCNDNLSLLLQHSPQHWQHQMWLAVFASTNVVPLRFEDFISPTSLELREKALVKKVGTNKSMTSCLAFSYLLKEHLQTMHDQALELRANSEEPLQVIFHRLVTKSPWCPLLERVVPPEARENFMHDYTIDFIRMSYRSSTYCDNELECVSCALDMTMKLLSRQLYLQQDSLISSLILLHLAYANIQGTLTRFARLVEVCPDLVNEQNTKRLMKPESKVSLDIAAMMIAVESFQLDHTKWKQDEDYRQHWLRGIQHAKPVIDNILHAVMGDYNDGDGNKGADDKLKRTRILWGTICVLKLFIEHVCQPSADAGHEFVGLLWMSLRKKPEGIKSVDGIEAVEKILSLCSNKAAKNYFQTDISNCPICKNHNQTEPVQLPCQHVCCTRCIVPWLERNDRMCPVCKTQVPEDYELHLPTESRESYKMFSAFRQRCNTFFMDVVSQLCFTDGSPPNKDVVKKLLSHVTKATADDDDAQQLHTKRMTAFKDDSIDPTPVIRSLLLQLLLQSNVDDVQDYMDMYLTQSQQVLSQHDPDNIVNVCLLFMHCMEDSYHREATRHNTNPNISTMEHAIHCLSAGRDWLTKKDPNEGLSVRYLTAIAKIRYGLVIMARYLHQMKCVSNKKQGDMVDMEQFLILLGEANQTCMAYHEAHLFLVRHLCCCYGSSTMDTLLQHPDIDWIRPHELEAQHDDIPDQFVICGQAYGVLREATAEAMITGQLDLITTALQKCEKLTASQRETSLLLAMFREVTMAYGREEERQIQPEMVDGLIVFLDESIDIRQKEFVEHMIRNTVQSGACSHLVVSPQQGALHQSVMALVMHTLITLICSADNPLLQPLVSLLHRPEQMQRSYLPTMPEDVRVVAQRAVRGRERVYECPNGHLYTVSNCGRPTERKRCTERGCDEYIGGQNHQPVQGNVEADLSLRGHTLGDPEARLTRPTGEGQLYPIATCVLRVIMHSAMISAAVIQPQEVQRLCHPPPPVENIGQFLWQHILKDLEQLSMASGQNPDDCLLMIHIVLQLITAKKPKSGGRGVDWDELLNRRDSRDAWEMAFAQRYLQPVIENLDTELAAGNTALQADLRFSTNPLMRLLHHQPMTRLTSPDDTHNLHAFPEVWQYRPQVTLESLQQYLGRQKSPVDGRMTGVGDEDHLVLLRRFLKKAHVLSVARHLPDLLRLQQILIDEFHRRIDASEADKTTIEDFLTGANKEVEDLVEIFISVWNQVREDVFRQGGIPTVPRELCFSMMNKTNSLAMLLPSDRQPGVCSTALVQFLMSTHNEFMDFYHGLSGNQQRCKPVPSCNVTVSHLVTFDLDKDLLPLLLANKSYTVRADQGTTQTFNLMALQRQIEERFIRGRSKLDLQIKRLAFRQELQDAAVFQKLRRNVPQKPLTPAVQHEILSQIKSVSALSDTLAALDIAIGFLASSSSTPDVRISDYLHSTLSLPEDRGIKSIPKAHKCCRLSHILALWQILAVERACRQYDNDQDPFIGVAAEYQEKLGNDHIASLVKVRRHINVKHLICELYEYIVLHLAQTGNKEQDTTQYSIVDVLEAYMDEKHTGPTSSTDVTIHGLQKHFPQDIQLQHACHTWQILVDFTQSYASPTDSGALTL